ncbi:MAG: histidine kinase [Chitinophagaceae bacterium]|nr:MAG: histidine kinase [Chitinophagaceae bacterium]
MERLSFYKKTGTVVLHVIAWLVVFSLPYLLRYNYDDRMRQDPDGDRFLYLGIGTWILWIICFYINAWLLTPRLIYRQQYIAYILVTTVIFLLVMLVHGRIFQAFINNRAFRFGTSVAFNLPTFVLVLAASMAFKVLGDKYRNDRVSQARQEETLKTELSFLRSQISPHFVFNILNNITALARLKSDQLEPTVLKLSSLLRYMLYETNEEKVPLQTEIGYLNDYIELQKQRFGKKLTISTSMEEVNTGYDIEPMLLIPFVENAFKHGVGMLSDPQILIGLEVKDSVLRFTVDNKFSPVSDDVKDKTSGIGLANVKRRLNLLYNKTHQLGITSNDGWYRVKLELNLRA